MTSNLFNLLIFVIRFYSTKSVVVCFIENVKQIENIGWLKTNKTEYLNQLK